MCLGIPGKVEEIFDENGLKMGNINYGGTLNRACLEYVPDIKVGQYTVVHAGFGQLRDAAGRIPVTRV